MKNSIIKLFFVATVVMFWSCNSGNAQKTESAVEVDMNDESQKAAYSLGVNVGLSFKSQKLDEDLDVEQIIQGMRDALKGEEKVSDQEARANLDAYFQAKREKDVAANLEKGNQFLAENGARKEVTTTASGLQYEVMKPGDGVKPTTSDRVSVHYHGTLIDGSVFDSSVERGQPATFGVTQVIAGWTEALQLMPVGSKYKLFIPANLAYGEQGSRGGIGPNEALVFEVELIEIVK